MAGVAFLKSPEWLWRGVVVVLLLGQYWVQSNFLPRAEFAREKDAAAKQYAEDKKIWWERLAKLNENLNALDVSIRLWEANKSTMTDHEARIRALEKRP